MINKKQVEGFPDYTVYSDGRIFSHNRNRFLVPTKDKYGYLTVQLSSCGETKRVKVPRIVSLAFIPNEEDKPQVNHINEIKDDNNVSNLEWVTNKENMNHGTGLQRSIDKRSKAIIGTSLSDGSILIFKSIGEAKRLGGFNPSGVSRCLHGKLKSHHNYCWKFMFDNN
ncbi:HNH homing endonuclease [Listeria phage LP-KV022]|uniref:HNH homing endonuclease n=2 Tax=Homburgvirus LP110 TaxID=1921128 RepID=A0A5A4K5R8_9CAUD|nr:HNH endonuclease [Listeria phage LP-110]AGI11593.1 HNH homing endonuclease [Listeria phage LP-110]AWY07672.1 HNH homing endonuclease [Listeria phage LP-KV022]